MVDSPCVGINGFLPGNVSAVHLRGFGAFLIVADTLFMIVLPIAGGHGGIVISQKAADMYIASATTCTGYVANGIAASIALKQQAVYCLFHIISIYLRNSACGTVQQWASHKCQMPMPSSCPKRQVLFQLLIKGSST